MALCNLLENTEKSFAKLKKGLAIGALSLASLLAIQPFSKAEATPLENPTTLHLSQRSSDETNPDLLDARLKFDYNESQNTLDLTLYNDTAEPYPYRITEIYFNTSSDIESIALASTPSAYGEVALSFNQSADGFGYFSNQLDTGRELATHLKGIAASTNVLYTFDIAGSNVDISDFILLSTVPPGEYPSLAAAHFQSGPNDDSAFGNSVDGYEVPDLSTFLLLASGAAATAFALRKSKKK